MLAKSLISQEFPTLRTSDSGEDAHRLMDEFKVSHLPIVNNEDFLGLLSEEDLFALNNASEPIGNHTLSLFKPFVDQYQHIFDVIELASREKLTVIPVLSKTNLYIGSILLRDLVIYFGQHTALNNPGGIIVLELNENDYSLAAISNIIEANDAKVLSCFITTYPDSTKVEVSLKINKMNIYPVLQAFDRHNYTILASFSEQSERDDMMDRYNSLMNYLNL